MNVTVTPEQHALLLDLARFTDTSAAGFLRSMLDAATPLLRQTVPELREVGEEAEHQFEIRKAIFQHYMEQLREAGFIHQLDMLEHMNETPTGATGPSVSEGGRPGRRLRK